MKKRMKTTAFFAVLAAAVLGLSGCGDGGGQTVTVPGEQAIAGQSGGETAEPKTWNPEPDNPFDPFATPDTGTKEKETGSAPDTREEGQMPAGSGTGPWVPDPLNVFGVEGVYNSTGTEPDGKVMDLYTYTFTGTAEQVAKMAYAYGAAMTDDGYTIKKVRYQNAVLAYDFTKDGYLASIAFFVKEGAENIADGGSGTWIGGLCVQHGMSFTPGQGTPNVRNGSRECPGCRGTGRCMGCFGSGQVNYGAGYEECTLCEGSGICNICGGLGY